MSTSIFTKIINGEIPSHKIYEDELTYAFLDINPVAEGHVLVIPKREVEFVWDLEDEDYFALMQTVKRVGLRIRDVIKKQYVGEYVVGTDVPHAHVHVVAFNEVKELKRVTEGPRTPSDNETLRALAERLRFE